MDKINILASVLRRLELANVERETIAITGDRETARRLTDEIRDNILSNGHVDTGNMLRNTVSKQIGGEWTVQSTTYAKYVDGISGFITDAVDQVQSQGGFAMKVV